MVDSLHANNLGTMKKFATELVWQLIYNDRFAKQSGATQEDWIERSCQSLRSQLNVFEAIQAKDNPKHKATKVQMIDGSVIGIPSSRSLKLKAAETKAFLFVDISCAQTCRIQPVW